VRRFLFGWLIDWIVNLAGEALDDLGHPAHCDGCAHLRRKK
jgi:hypothetical protein